MRLSPTFFECPIWKSMAFRTLELRGKSIFFESVKTSVLTTRRGDAFRIEISFALQWLILVELECNSNCNPLRIRFMLKFEQKNHPSKLYWWNFTVTINLNFDHLFCFPREFFRSANQNTNFLVRSLLCGSILRLRWIKPSLFCMDLGSMKTFRKFGSWRKLPVRE